MHALQGLSHFEDWRAKARIDDAKHVFFGRSVLFLVTVIQQLIFWPNGRSIWTFVDLYPLILNPSL